MGGIVRRVALFSGAAALAAAAAFGIERRQNTLDVERDALWRGRGATSPFQMPLKGWRDILLRMYLEIFADRLLSIAGSVAFFTLLSIVPAISALISIYGLAANTGDIVAQLEMISIFLPAAAIELIRDQAMRLAAQPVATLSTTLAVSLTLSLWTANGATKSLFDALNVIYDETERRSFLKLNAISLVTTLTTVLLMVVALVVIAIVPALLALSPLFMGYQDSAVFKETVALVRWPLFFMVTTGAMMAFYRIGPSRRPPQWRWLVPGAVLAALLWMLFSAVFSWYVSTLGSYSATYGSLATVIVFMTWLWFSLVIVLLGASLNAELEHQTACDTTVGAPKPIGTRGAAMADRVGPSQ